MKKLGILIIEDDEDFLKPIKNVLEKNEYNVSVSRDGEQGLTLAEKIKPDLIILDIMLPKKDGYAVCHSIKENPSTKHIPVLILTSLGKDKEGKNGAELLSQGHKAEGFLEKPVDPQVLVDTAASLISNASNREDEKVKVLVIDDDPDFIAAVKMILEKNDYQVFIEYSGEDGLIAVKKQKPDIILLDVMLPNKDGYAVCKELKEDEKTSLIPVILITSVGSKLTESEYGKAIAVTHKADDYIEKPVEQKELLQRIRQFIGPRRRIV
ncbi:MAG: response regulator [bacterium]